jgi:hypothetical protein
MYWQYLTGHILGCPQISLLHNLYTWYSIKQHVYKTSTFVISHPWCTQEFFFWVGGDTRIFFWGGREGGVPTNSVEDRGQRKRGSGGNSPLVRGSTQCKWMKPIWLDCYGYIFHGNGNSAQLWQNFGISGGRGLTPPGSVCHCKPYSLTLSHSQYNKLLNSCHYVVLTHKYHR